jgi:hypothetical protein
MVSGKYTRIYTVQQKGMFYLQLLVVQFGDRTLLEYLQVTEF